MLFLFNADFERRIRGGKIPPKIRRAVDESAALFVPALTPQDRVYSTCGADDSYYAYLHRAGLSPAHLSSACAPEHRGEAWAADGHAHRFLTENCAHADLAPAQTVQWCNSRRCAAQLYAAKPDLGVPHSGICTTVDAMAQYVGTHKDVLFKPNLGNAADGFIFTRAPVTETFRRKARHLLKYAGAVAAEPRLQPIEEIATALEVSRGGAVTIRGHHRNICNRRGTFYANLVAREDSVIRPWKDRLDAAAQAVGTTLARQGFFGRAGLDSFTYRDKTGTLRLAAAVDINARHTISSITYALQKKTAAPVLFYRFISRRRLNLPDSYDGLERALHPFFRSREPRPVLCTPLRLHRDGHSFAPARSAFCITGHSPEEVLHTDERLRKALLKRRNT
ncbi:MAG: hypothetical protein ACQEQV_06815 [Fibrobacterota bacterium]